MKKIWETFEEMNELVYAVDMETYQLVYMNRKLREASGVLPGESYAGKKCHEVLQNCLEPCAACDNCRLEEGQFIEYEKYNPSMDKYFLIKSTLIRDEGHSYRMEIAVDVTSYERRGDALQSYQTLERFVFEGLRTAMRETDPEKSIDIVLEYLGKALRGERTYVFEKNKNGSDNNTYEWVANGVTPEKENLQEVPEEVCAHWYQRFEEGKNIIIEDLEYVRKKDPLQYEILKRQNIHSLVVVPLYDEGRAIGFYGVDNPPAGSLDYAENMLQIMGYFIVNYIRRRNLFQKMNHMSRHDQLTGLGNRYAMEEYIRVLQGEKNRGVVYCDVTGLKRVNDTQGHKEGDDLLLRAARCIEKVFEGYGLFRVGGDEFLILCKDIEKADLEKKVALLKEEAQKNNANLAIGLSWEHGSEDDVEELYARAEALMYNDKADFYKRMGIDRRRR